MKRMILLAIAGMALLAGCSGPVNTTGRSSAPELGWLFLEKGPYTLSTHVDAAPGPASFELVKDLSLMADVPEVVLRADVTVAPDSTLEVALGKLEPGFYQVRLRDSVRWNIGVRPDDVVSAPDAPADFDAFWASTLEELSRIPLEPVLTEIPEHSNEVRTTYHVSYPAYGGAVSGGVVCIPNAPGKYPVSINYMGYGADVYYMDPSANPGCIEYLVSVRDQGIYKGNQERWIDRGITSKETFYYRGAFCDVKQAVDFAASLEKADTTRMVAWGESQGGAFTFISAALDPRIKAIAPSVPFLGDYRDYARIVWWPVHEVFAEADSIGLPREELLDMLRYFDVKNFAPRIHCPVYMAFGLQDPTCPPHTNFSIYNNLGTTDKRYLCVPTCGHGMWAEKVWETERAAFLHPFLYPLRVGTYNLRFSNLDNKSEENNWTLREPRLLQSFLSCDMDICGVEEIGSAEQESLPRQLSARGLSYDSYFFDPYADDGVGTRAHGLLWKKDLFSLAGEPHFFWLSNPPDVRQSNDTVPAWKANYTRGGFCLTLKDKADHRYFVMVTHAPLNKEQHAANASIYADMERRYNPEGLPSFFVGDFNANEADACSAVHRSYWADAYRAVPSPAGPEGTFNAWKWEAPSADHRIDFIYYRGEGVTPVAYTCDNTLYGGYPSDHFPVYADFFVMEQAPVRTAQVPF